MSYTLLPSHHHICLVHLKGILLMTRLMLKRFYIHLHILSLSPNQVQPRTSLTKRWYENIWINLLKYRLGGSILCNFLMNYFEQWRIIATNFGLGWGISKVQIPHTKQVSIFDAIILLNGMCHATGRWLTLLCFINMYLIPNGIYVRVFSHV